MFPSGLAALFSVLQLVAAQCPSLPSPLPSAYNLPSDSQVPNPWKFYNGTALSSTTDWACRKSELMTLVQEYMWGYYPDHSQETVTATRNGNSLRITVSSGGRSASFDASVTLPGNGNGAVPVLISPGYIDSNAFLSAGIAVATFDTNAIASDSNSKSGAFWSLYNGRDIGVLLAWGWGFHRIIDAIEQTMSEIDTTRVAVTGCSRWGKGALAAGIFDERVALTIPMSSGVYGTSPFRHRFEQGGWNERLSSNFDGAPWWSTSRIGQFVSAGESRLPFDAATFVSLIAPRAVVFDQGQTDYQMNPQGVATVTFPAAQAVYKWLGAQDKIGLALRNGGHCDPSGVSNILDFVKKTFFGTSTSRDYTDTKGYPSYTQGYTWGSNPPSQ